MENQNENEKVGQSPPYFPCDGLEGAEEVATLHKAPAGGLSRFRAYKSRRIPDIKLGFLALHAQDGDSGKLKEALEAVLREALIEAVRDCNPDTVGLLLHHSAPVDGFAVRHESNQRYPLLLLAVLWDDVESVALLLRAKAHILGSCKLREYPIHPALLATALGNWRMFSLLRDHIGIPYGVDLMSIATHYEADEHFVGNLGKLNLNPDDNLGDIDRTNSPLSWEDLIARIDDHLELAYDCFKSLG